MSSIWLYALLSVLVVSALSLIGVLVLSVNAQTLRRWLIVMVSFSAGALLGDAFLHLLPELVEEYGEWTLNMSLGIIAGMLIFFILEKVIHWHHCHSETPKDHVHPFAITNLVGDAMHNFIDGVIIGAAYLVSIPIGVATTIAVALHEIPQEVGDFGVLLHGGFTKKKALLINFGTALFAVLGVVFALILGETAESAVEWLIPIAAGSFLYIAASDLIPELHKETHPVKSAAQVVAFVLGLCAMALLLFLE